MSFKAKKSRSLVVKKGKVTEKFILKIQGEQIPLVNNKPIKRLGKWFDDTLTDKRGQGRLQQQVEEALRQVRAPWEVQGMDLPASLIPRLFWPLVIYDIPTRLVERIEQKIRKHTRRWLGLPTSFNNVWLYGRCIQLQVPLTSLVEKYKTAKVRVFMTLRDSSDDKIRQAGIQLRTGRKWSVSQEVKQGESRLRHKDIVGSVNQARECLGARQHQQWCKTDQYERRAMVQAEIRKGEDDQG